MVGERVEERVGRVCERMVEGCAKRLKGGCNGRYVREDV